MFLNEVQHPPPMLQKIKNVLEIHNELDKLKKSWHEHTQQATTLTKQLQDVQQGLHNIQASHEEITKAQLEILHQFTTNLTALDTIQDKFRQELDNFSIFKKDMQRQILQKFEQELSNELIKQSQELQLQGKEYVQVKQDITIITQELTLLQQEIKKFTAISQHIKGKDFEMNKFAQELLSMNKHKLELMQKIDSLERLVSRLRRK
jgi:DNA repair exonuclease SbcCD ATPase subunit